MAFRAMPRRVAGARLLAFASAAVAAMVVLPSAPLPAEPAPLSFVAPSRGAACGRAVAVAREAAPSKYGSSRYKTYDGFVFRKKMIPGLRLRLDRFGTGHWPFYRILATFQKRRCPRSSRFLERIGFWDPMKQVKHPEFMKIKADRAVHWLRMGAQPTDQVASLLDMIGIIRRTGPDSKRGNWEWRIPKNSGPEAPEGWSYDGPHRISWGNKPMTRHQPGHPHSLKKVRNLALIERFGFKGYEKIPIDHEEATDPTTRSSLLSSFGNTELPMY